MYLVSARKNNWNPDVISDDDDTYGHIDLADPDQLKIVMAQTSKGSSENRENMLAKLSNKKVLILVHGYNNTYTEVIEAYLKIAGQVSNVKLGFDKLIGYTWPGGDSGIDWFQASKAANAIDGRFSRLITNLKNTGATIDIMSHSLGCRVVLKGLNRLINDTPIRNVYTMAAAVDNECLETGEEFNKAIRACERFFIFHSRHDLVLDGAYRAAEFDRALGLFGPEDPSEIEKLFGTQGDGPKVHVVNCKKVVKGHGEYKNKFEVFQKIKDALESPENLLTLDSI